MTLHRGVEFLNSVTNFGNQNKWCFIHQSSSSILIFIDINFENHFNN